MRKIFNFFVFFIIVAVVAVYLFFYNINVEKKIKSNYYLLFHSNLTINKLSKDKIFPWKLTLEGVSDKYFYITEIKCNLLLRTIKVINSMVFSDKSKFNAILNDLKYINIPFKSIELISVNLISDNFNLQKGFGDIDLNRGSIKTTLFGYINNYFALINSDIKNFQNIKFALNFKNIDIKSIVKILDIPVTLPYNALISSQIKYFGNVNSKLQKKFSIFFDNNTFSGFIKKNEIATTIYNSKIILPNNSEVAFSGQFISPKNFKIILQSNSAITGKYKNIAFNNVKFEFMYEKSPDINQGNLNVAGDFVEISDSSMFFNNTNRINMNVKLQRLQVADNILQNVDISTAIFNSKTSYNKLNFDLNDGSFIFSYIPEIDSNSLQIAADIKNIKLKDFFKLLDMNVNFNGNFNCSFIAEGKNKKLLSGKGYFFIENFLINGINLDNVTKEIAENNIVNFSYVFDNSTDNENSNFEKFDVVKGFVMPENNFLKFYKVSLLSRKGFLLLSGNLDLDNMNNLILKGVMKFKRKNEKIILNLNFDKKIVQILKR